jgi:flagellar M-ring protein FliF
MTNTDVSRGKAATGPSQNPLVRLVNELGLVRLTIMAAVAGGVVLGVVYLTGQLTKPPMGLLFGNLDFNDAASISEQLRQQNVPFELKGGGNAIFVEQSKVLDLRVKFASQGMPSGQDVGYELFDKENPFGQTSFHLNLNRQRALEGELARTIRAINKIEQARVHLVLPQHELFERDEKKPSASIVVKTRGSLNEQTVNAIQHLVASAVEGLDPSNISIVDERGTLLVAGGKSQEEAMATLGLEDRQAGFEERMRQRILDIVSKFAGAGSAQVQVAAELDFNRVTEQSTVFDPNTQVVASTNTVEDHEQSSDKGSGEQGVTVANALPENQNTKGASSASTPSTSASTHAHNEEQTTYQNSQTVRTEVREPGKVLRLSVAVLVDGSYDTDPKGNRTYKTRGADELKQIETLVKAGIGFDEKRGDQVSITNLPFAQLSLAPEGAEKAPLLGLTKSDYIYIAQLAALVILGLVGLLFVARPLVLQFLRVANGLPAPIHAGKLAVHGGAGATGAIAGGGTAALSGGDPNAMSDMPRLQMQRSAGSQIDIAQIEGHVKDSSVKKVGEVVANHPEESVAILRNWLQQTD